MTERAYSIKGVDWDTTIHADNDVEALNAAAEMAAELDEDCIEVWKPVMYGEPGKVRRMSMCYVGIRP